MRRVSYLVGKALTVNLSNKKIAKKEISHRLMRQFIGGVGLGAKYLFDEVEPAIDPFSPENKVIFAPGALAGTPFPSSSRLSVVSKSPLTRLYGDSNAGGFIAVQIKQAGYDLIIFSGKSDKPVYVWINDDNVEIRDASHLWGKNVLEADSIIKKDIGDNEISTALIGQAGENLVRFACVMNEVWSAAGRTGIGAVMGSKHLKGFAVRGTSDIVLTHPEKFDELYSEYLKMYEVSTGHMWIKYGINFIVEDAQKRGTLQTKNCYTGVFKDADKIGGEALRKYTIKTKSCLGCYLRCRRCAYVKSGVYAGSYCEPIEFDMLEAWGSKVLNSDLESIIAICRLLDLYGMDVISAGDTVAWALECYEKGILTKEDADGLELKWGDPELLITLIRKIAFREGFGNLLAEGSRIAAAKVGKGADYYAMHAKGLEFSSRDPRTEYDRALAYAVSNRGSDHLTYVHSFAWQISNEDAEKFGLTPIQVDSSIPKGIGKFLKWNEDINIFKDILGLCWWPYLLSVYPLISIKLAVKYYHALTGIDLTEDELMRVGERTINVKRAFNVREGVDRRDDTLPERFFAEPLPEGPAKGKRVKKEIFEKIKDEYYEARGWDKVTTVPLRRRLERLGLHDVADKLARFKNR